jgi:transcription elongation factor GreA
MASRSIWKPSVWGWTPEGKSMNVQPVLLTREGCLKLEQELKHLSTARRREVAERLRQTSPGSSLLEDGELEDAFNEWGFLEGRIRRLASILSNATVIEDSVACDFVVPGIHVTVVDRDGDGTPEVYRVVGSAEADPALGNVSTESPLGRALMGRGVGDNVVVEAPDGTLVFEIVEIHPVHAMKGGREQTDVNLEQ